MNAAADVIGKAVVAHPEFMFDSQPKPQENDEATHNPFRTLMCWHALDGRSALSYLACSP
jgi:hypothetical protein